MTGYEGGRSRRLRARWHQSHPLFRLSAQAGVVAVLVVAGFIPLTVSDVISETAASVLVAVVFGAATVLQLRQSQRRQHTVELLTNFQSTELLAIADVWMAKRIAAHEAIEVAIGVEDERNVITILDYYEFLCSLAIRGFVDVPLLLNLRGGAMTRCFHICHDYIANQRAEVGDELYRSFELIVDEHRRRIRDLDAIMRPTPEP